MPPPRAAAPTTLETLFRGSVVVALVLLFCYVASTVVITFVVAVICAYVLEPFVSALEYRRVPRLLAILLAIGSSLAALGLLGYFLWVQVEGFQQDFPKYRHELEQLVDAVREPNPLVTGGGRLLGAVNVFVALTLIPCRTFFLLSGKDFFKRRTVALLCNQGLEADRCLTLRDDMNRQIRGFVIGKVFLHGVLAGLTTAALLVIGVDDAWIWGPLSAVVTLIPIFGFLLGMIPPVLIALLQFDSLTRSCGWWRPSWSSSSSRRTCTPPRWWG